MIYFGKGDFFFSLWSIWVNWWFNKLNVLRVPSDVPLEGGWTGLSVFLSVENWFNLVASGRSRTFLFSNLVHSEGLVYIEPAVLSRSSLNLGLEKKAAQPGDGLWNDVWKALFSLALATRNTCCLQRLGAESGVSTTQIHKFTWKTEGKARERQTDRLCIAWRSNINLKGALVLSTAYKIICFNSYSIVKNAAR